MTTIVQATLVNGVFLPDQEIDLPESSRVQLTIQTLDEQRAQALEAWKSILASLAESPLHLGGKRYTREELYDRD